MLLIAGIDPGVTGALAVYDYDADKLLDVWPLPNYQIKVGKQTRTRLDEDEVAALFRILAAMGVKLVGIENVQGGNYAGKKQTAAGAFQFGYTFGTLRMGAVMANIMHDAASPAVWKLREQVPKDPKAIVRLADKAFPEHKAKFHGPKGGSYHDIAEACFLARYFARNIWPSMQPQAGLRTLAKGLGRNVA